MSSAINATSNSNSTVSGQVDIQAKDIFVTTGATVGTTETTINIPVGVKSFRLQVAASETGAVVLTISHTSGGTASNLTSFDIYPGSSLPEEFLKGDNSLTLYIKSNKSNTPVQLLYWT